MTVPLSFREREVLQLVLAGKSNKEIGAMLFVTAKTISTHLNKIYRKLAVHNRAQLYAVIVGGNGKIVGDDFHSLNMRITRIETILLQLGLAFRQCTATDNAVAGAGGSDPPPPPDGTNTTSTQ